MKITIFMSMAYLYISVFSMLRYKENVIVRIKKSTPPGLTSEIINYSFSSSLRKRTKHFQNLLHILLYVFYMHT